MAKQMTPVDALAAILAARKSGKLKKAPPPRPQKYKAPAQMPSVYVPPPS